MERWGQHFDNWGNDERDENIISNPIDYRGRAGKYNINIKAA